MARMKYSEAFGRLLTAAISSIAAMEAKNVPAIEADLGRQCGISGATIERYKGGQVPPELDRVRILAEAAIKRGYKSRDWLQRFLHVAGYPAPEVLLNQLCPIGTELPRPKRVYHNLPSPIYSKFVMRLEEYNALVDALSQRSALVLVHGFGGFGKTSLVLELAYQCLQETSIVPKFDAIIWVTDKPQPGTTTLSGVLDKIAITLDYRGLTHFDYERKREEVEQLLGIHRVLVVIDNYETIKDAALLPWLQRLPMPSKAIVSSRDYTRAFRNNATIMPLGGMNDAETQEFITHRLKALGIEKLVEDRAQLIPLISTVGTNPKALEITLGYLKYARTLQPILTMLHSARGDLWSELFDELFDRCWKLLDMKAQRVLQAAALFPFGADEKALAEVANVHDFDFIKAEEQLSDLSLLDVLQENMDSGARFTLHPLVRTFATAQLRADSSFEEAARDRWVKWYGQLAYKIGFCWDDLKKLELLDVHHEQETIQIVIAWAFENHRYSDAIQIARDSRYYYYVRGLWMEPHNIIRAHAAQELKDDIEEFQALVYHINIMSKQGNLSEVEVHLPRLREISQSVRLSEKSMVEFRHAEALYFLAQGDLDVAQRLWEENLGHALDPHDWNTNRRWFATCLYRKSKIEQSEELLNKAQKLLLATLDDALQKNFMRGVVSIETTLASIDLDRKDRSSAAKRLSRIMAQATENKDRMAVAETYRVYARLYTLEDDLPAALGAIKKAVDLFMRLGLQEELGEARHELAHLEMLAFDR